MKTLPLALSVLLLSLLVLAGCGKSAEQKQMESDLNKRVMAMHDTEMAKMRQAQDLTSQLDSVMSMHDALVGKYPKETVGHSSDDINVAKEKLASARAAMDAWMSGHKPYDENVTHTEVMAKLNADIQGLEKVREQADTAIADATSVIESHRKAAADLLAKKSPKKSWR
ncbi:MAG: hypothetical protein H6Q30_698 [Bacteroidetes bacterium]|jgi:uncharacterized protein YacL (UPF0231 family)|nr:hypothetical protein [Bacteroidota bacterium]